MWPAGRQSLEQGVADFLAIVQRPDRSPPEGVPAGLRWTARPWGGVATTTAGWREVQGGALVAGRPAQRGGGEVEPAAVAGALAADASRYASISGIFLLLRHDDRGLSICTDRLSHIAAYAFEDAGRVIISTQVEWIAELTGASLDEVSLAELILWDNPTFPHTTRVGIRQLAPGACHAIDAGVDHPRIETTHLWQPVEPQRWPSKRACIDAAIAGAQASAREIASGASRLGVMLSGGLDSRIVAAELLRHAEVEAFTYLDHANREAAAAERTATALGIRHHLVYREPAFYASAFDRGLALVGFEQNAIPCHSLCLVDHPSLGSLDAIVGGFGCDILMKSAYVPYAMKDLVLAHRGLARVRPERRIGKHNYSQAHKRRALIRRDLLKAALERREAYEEQIRAIRPRSAEEWIGFYPVSQTTSIDSAAADRCFPHDEFFFHADLVEASAMTPAVWKKGLDVISAVGKALAPTVAGLPHPDSGRPATLRYYPERVLSRLAPRRSPSIAPKPGAPSWYSDGSFVKYAAFFADCPEWIARREAAFSDADAVDALSRILAVDPREVLGRGESRYGSLLNAMAVQLLRLFARDAQPRGDAREAGL